MKAMLIGGTNDGREAWVHGDYVKRMKMVKKNGNPVYQIKNDLMEEEHEEEIYLLQKISTPTTTLFIGVHEDITLDIALSMLVERYKANKS